MAQEKQGEDANFNSILIDLLDQIDDVKLLVNIAADRAQVMEDRKAPNWTTEAVSGRAEGITKVVLLADRLIGRIQGQIGDILDVEVLK